jgi:hypothetical protein
MRTRTDQENKRRNCKLNKEIKNQARNNDKHTSAKTGEIKSNHYG